MRHTDVPGRPRRPVRSDAPATSFPHRPKDEPMRQADEPAAAEPSNGSSTSAALDWSAVGREDEPRGLPWRLTVVFVAVALLVGCLIGFEVTYAGRVYPGVWAL